MKENSIDKDAISLTELADSAFHVTPLMTEYFMSITHSSFVLVPHINSNNGLILEANQVQNCHDNLYYV